MLARFNASVKRYTRKRAALNTELHLIQRKIKELKQPYWGEDLIGPIAAAISKDPRMSEHPVYQVMGPFGICGEMPIHFYKLNVPDDERFQGDNCRSVTFVSRNTEDGLTLKMVDYSVNTGEYAEGSIGAMNGMNHPRVDLPDTIRGIVDFMTRFLSEDELTARANVELIKGFKKAAG